MSNIIEFFRSRILQKKNLFAFVCAAIFIFLFLIILFGVFKSLL